MMDGFIFGSFSTLEKRLAIFQNQNQGIKHHNRISPRSPQVTDSPRLTVTIALPETFERVVCKLTEPETAVYPFNLVETKWDLLNWQYRQVWKVTLPPQPEGTLVRYTIEAYPTHSDTVYGADDGQVFSYLVGDPSPPEWSQSAIVYQIFPDRFYPGDGRSWNKVRNLMDIYGGTLRGVINKLDYIAGLGFNCLWLNPFFPDKTHHGYHATDYFAVNPRLGTMDDIIELVEKAHAKGIRLLLDFVANHWGSGHETFKIAQADRGSDYYNWYLWRSWPHDYETYYHVKELPKINVNYPAARAYLMKSVRFWLGEIRFDGLRLDHVLGPSHDFWTELRAVAKGVKADAWMFGEATDTPDVQLSYAGRFDGCLDFILGQALRNTFALGRMDVTIFDAFLNKHEAFFPTNFSRPSFLDNHDMDRFLWMANGDKRRLKLAALCQFTLSGPPIVYNGLEVGVSQNVGISAPGSLGMVECRQPMLWGEAQDKDLVEFYRWLIHFRRQHPVIWQTPRKTVHLDPAAGTYAYFYTDQSETVLVAFNLSDKEKQVSIHLPDQHLTHTFSLPSLGGDVYVQQKAG